jgi:hypothetical protein
MLVSTSQQCLLKGTLRILEPDLLDRLDMLDVLDKLDRLDVLDKVNKVHWY